MRTEAVMSSEEASSSTPPIIGDVRPKFDGYEPPALTEVGFRHEIEENPEPPEEEQTAVVAVEKSQDALVVIEPTERTKILPHLELDYSNYAKVDYPRIDPGINLRSVQEEAVDTYISETNKRRVIISLPTGTGKTIAGLSIAGRVNGRVLWIAHRDELIEQPAEEIARLFPRMDFGIEKASKRDGRGKRIVISSIQTLSRKNRILEIMQGAPFSVVVYDECLPGDETVITDSGHMRMDDPSIVGARVLAWSAKEEAVVFRPVLRHIIRNERQLFRVSTRDGRVIRCTENERFLSAGEWKTLTELSVGDLILTVDTGFVHAAAASGSSRNDRTTACLAQRTAGAPSRASLSATERPGEKPEAGCAHVVAESEPQAVDSVLPAVTSRDISESGHPVSRTSTSSDDYILSIEQDGFEVVYDIEVEEDHNFVTSSGFVVHNCHHSTATQAMRVLSWLGCFREDGRGPRLLGLTATIERADKTSLGHVFEDVIYSLSIQEAIELGFLVPPKPIKVPLPINKKALRTTEGDYNASDLDRELARLNAAQATSTAVLAYCKGRKTIVFCVSVDQAKRTAEACTKLGFRGAWASGQPHMNKTERKRVLKMFTAGEIDVLCSAELLSEGYDERSVSAVVIARPTKSQSRYVQQAGRGLRTCQHKTDCLLIDIVGASDLGFVTADILLKKPDKKIKRKPRRRTDVPIDSSTEWQRLRSYLRSAKVDLIEHGEITFARASDDMIVTVAMDSHLVILRRVGKVDEDLWVIEHKEVVYTLAPLPLQEAMSICDVLIPTFGGSAKPDSPEWDKATESPTPPPGVMPTHPSSPEATQISDPATQLPLAVRLISNPGGAADLVDQVNNDILNANSAAFAKGLRLAFEKKMCHLLSVNKSVPDNREKWGWSAQEGMPPNVIKDVRGPMIGWVHGDLVCVDPGPSVEIARKMLKEAGDETEIKTSPLRTHLGTVNKTFKDMRRDWIKVKTKDVEPASSEASS